MGFFAPSKCERCGCPLGELNFFFDLTLGNALTKFLHQRRHYGYFCSPECLQLASLSGRTGSKHSMFQPRFEEAVRELMIYKEVAPIDELRNMTHKQLLALWRESAFREM